VSQTAASVRRRVSLSTPTTAVIGRPPWSSFTPTPIVTVGASRYIGQVAEPGMPQGMIATSRRGDVSSVRIASHPGARPRVESSAAVASVDVVGSDVAGLCGWRGDA
jgi:hypothetical protein